MAEQQAETIALSDGRGKGRGFIVSGHSGVGVLGFGVLGLRYDVKGRKLGA
jgi:hypothetical protein